MSVIYCVEDDDGIRELVSVALSSGGYEVCAFENAGGLYKALDERRPDLILLDIMLPDEDGVSVLERLKISKNLYDIPVIMLTAKSSEIDKVQSLEAGADDYITKPFGVMELLSRIKAVLRRVKRSGSENRCITIGAVSLDYMKRRVTCNNTEVMLTAREFELLACMMENKGYVMARDVLMNKVWGYDYEGITRTVDVHIKSVRQKLEEAGSVNFIRTVRGVGYKVEDADAEADI